MACLEMAVFYVYNIFDEFHLAFFNFVYNFDPTAQKKTYLTKFHFALLLWTNQKQLSHI